MRDGKLFDQVVKMFFAPIAQKHGLQLSKISEGIYDMFSPSYILRIRLDTGHRRGLDAALRPASFRKFDESGPGIQVGLSWFIRFNGGNPSDTFNEVTSDEQFIERAKLVARSAEDHAVPYLLGLGTGWEAVRLMIDKKTEDDVEGIKKYRFPKNVREEWI